MSKFIAASRQATELDKTRILLEKKEEAKELRNLNEELKTDVLERILVLTIFRRGTMS